MRGERWAVPLHVRRLCAQDGCYRRLCAICKSTEQVRTVRLRARTLGTLVCFLSCCASRARASTEHKVRMPYEAGWVFISSGVHAIHLVRRRLTLVCRGQA
ncbi:hypothetical protein FA95DRAFT_914781 [Auriscalpium vulgare]|uniref:Uncharacterized protein n=1 Tax=Auriscalpium vulgare TaxID=40419 RepID=A0ACB8R834_9AGAM|nr:hypothetical protein FA95DRAFT_914781 [Auriscalpium vulgare]